MLDLHKLHVFVIVAQEGSFSAAAERLYVTQSAISQHIKELEARFGRALFDRTRRGVVLTPHGETLLGYAHAILALVAEAESALTDVRHILSGRLSLGATPGVGVYLAPDWVQRFQAGYPQITVALTTGVTAQMVGDVLGQRLDLAVVEGELEKYASPRLTIQPLADVEQVVVVGQGHSFWARASVALADLNGQAFILRPANSQTRVWLNEVLRARQISVQVVAEFDNLESIKRAVAGGGALAILPPYAAQAEAEAGSLRRLPVEGGLLRRRLSLIYIASAHPLPVVRAFVEFLRTIYPLIHLP